MLTTIGIDYACGHLHTHHLSKAYWSLPVVPFLPPVKDQEEGKD